MWIKSKDGLKLCHAEEIVCFGIDKKGEYEDRKYYLRAFAKQGDVFNISILYDYGEAKEALKFLEDQLIPPQTNAYEEALKAIDNPGAYAALSEKGYSEDFMKGYGYAVSQLIAVSNGMEDSNAKNHETK